MNIVIVIGYFVCYFHCDTASFIYVYCIYILLMIVNKKDITIKIFETHEGQRIPLKTVLFVPNL